MTDDRTCGFIKDNGEACRVDFSLCSCHSMCFHHAPCRREEAREARRKGAAATNAQKREGAGLDPDDLPPLDSHEAAETWTDRIGRAAATGRISAGAANAALRAVKEWREAHDQGAVSDRLDALMGALETWRETGDESPVLDVIEGGRP